MFCVGIGAGTVEEGGESADCVSTRGVFLLKMSDRASISLFLRGSLVGSNSIDAPVACSFHYKLFIDP